MTRMERPAPSHSLHARARALASRHALIEGYLQQEMRRPLPNDAVLRTLKRRKLAVKDEIARIEGIWRTLGGDARVDFG